MPYSLTSSGTLARKLERLRQRGKYARPAARKWGAWLTREARRRAPRGRGRRMAGLAASLNHVEPNDTTTVLVSNKSYARIQNYGGQITAGGGALKSRLLAIPLNDDARRMLDGMGASVSLRSQNLVFIKSRSGRMFLIRADESKRSKRSKGGRGRKRRHRFHGGQIMFMLVPRVNLRPNPAPHGYAPRLDEPAVKAAAAKFLRQHLTAKE